MKRVISALAPRPLDGGYALVVVVAVIGVVGLFVGLAAGVAYALGRLLVAHSKQGGLQDVHVPLLDQVGEELQEECEQQQAYVHAVDIGVGGYDHFVVTQSVDPLLDVEGGLQQVEFLVLVHHFLRQTVGIERLALEREHCLGLHVAYLGD